MLRLSLTLSFLLLPAAGVAAQTVWEIAPGPSSLEFSVSHLLFTRLEGRFEAFEGRVECPGEGFEAARIQVVIPVNSVYTGHTDRDRNLMEPEFFDAAQFPQAVFESERFEQIEPGHYRLEGNLTLRGVTRRVTLTAEHRGTREAMGTRRADFLVRGHLNRGAFGLGSSPLLASGSAIVGQEVHLHFRIALLAEGAPVLGMR